MELKHFLTNNFELDEKQRKKVFIESLESYWAGEESEQNEDEQNTKIEKQKCQCYCKLKSKLSGLWSMFKQIKTKFKKVKTKKSAEILVIPKASPPWEEMTKRISKSLIEIDELFQEEQTNLKKNKKFQNKFNHKNIYNIIALISKLVQ